MLDTSNVKGFSYSKTWSFSLDFPPLVWRANKVLRGLLLKSPCALTWKRNPKSPDSLFRGEGKVNGKNKERRRLLRRLKGSGQQVGKSFCLGDFYCATWAIRFPSLFIPIIIRCSDHHLPSLSEKGTPTYKETKPTPPLSSARRSCVVSQHQKNNLCDYQAVPVMQLVVVVSMTTSLF